MLHFLTICWEHSQRSKWRCEHVRTDGCCEVSNLESAVIAALRAAPDQTIQGAFLLEQHHPDVVLDAVFALQDRGIVDGRFPPNPNRRQGSDFGWVRLIR